MFRVIKASCDAQNLPHWSYLPLPPMYKKWFLASSSFTSWSIMMKMFRVIIASCVAQNLPHLSYLSLPPLFKKCFFASHFFTVWSIMMKLHKNDQSNKSFLLAQKFCHLRLSAFCPGAIYVFKIMKKIYVKSEFKQSF